MGIFKRLFNWIKFKTLPPSLLFRNRLFLERDSKTRRVTTNLGLTFRNSKWADYSRTDINNSLKSQTLKKLLINTLTLLIILLWWSWVSPSVGFLVSSNDLFFLLWTLKDLIVYYFFTFFTFLVLALSKLIELLYVKLVGWLFLGTKPSPRLYYKTRLEYLKAEEAKYLYFNWLKTSSSSLTGNEFPNEKCSDDSQLLIHKFFSLLYTLTSSSSLKFNLDKPLKPTESVGYNHIQLFQKEAK